MEALPQLRLAMHQLVISRLQALDDKWQDIQADEFQTEELLSQAVEHRVQSMRTYLTQLKLEIGEEQAQVVP